MIEFDRITLRILRCINHAGDKGVSWDVLTKKFGEDAANATLLIQLSKELYTCTKDQDGHWINFENWSKVICGSFRSVCSPKGNVVLERRVSDFWRWAAPTLISVAALIVSVIALLR